MGNASAREQLPDNFRECIDTVTKMASAVGEENDVTNRYNVVTKLGGGKSGAYVFKVERSTDPLCKQKDPLCTTPCVWKDGKCARETFILKFYPSSLTEKMTRWESATALEQAELVKLKGTPAWNKINHSLTERGKKDERPFREVAALCALSRTPGFPDVHEAGVTSLAKWADKDCGKDKCFDPRVSNDGLYVVMSLTKGTALMDTEREYWQDADRGRERAASVSRQILELLRKAKATLGASFQHFDLHPDNIFVQKEPKGSFYNVGLEPTHRFEPSVELIDFDLVESDAFYDQTVKPGFYTKLMACCLESDEEWTERERLGILVRETREGCCLDEHKSKIKSKFPLHVPERTMSWVTKMVGFSYYMHLLDLLCDQKAVVSWKHCPKNTDMRNWFMITATLDLVSQGCCPPNRENYEQTVVKRCDKLEDCEVFQGRAPPKLRKKLENNLRVWAGVILSRMFIRAPLSLVGLGWTSQYAAPQISGQLELPGLEAFEKMNKKFGEYNIIDDNMTFKIKFDVDLPDPQDVELSVALKGASPEITIQFNKEGWRRGVFQGEGLRLHATKLKPEDLDAFVSPKWNDYLGWLFGIVLGHDVALKTIVVQQAAKGLDVEIVVGSDFQSDVLGLVTKAIEARKIGYLPLPSSSRVAVKKVAPNLHISVFVPLDGPPNPCVAGESPFFQRMMRTGVDKLLGSALTGGEVRVPEQVARGRPGLFEYAPDDPAVELARQEGRRYWERARTRLGIDDLRRGRRQVEQALGAVQTVRDARAVYRDRTKWFTKKSVDTLNEGKKRYRGFQKLCTEFNNCDEFLENSVRKPLRQLQRPLSILIPWLNVESLCGVRVGITVKLIARDKKRELELRETMLETTLSKLTKHIVENCKKVAEGKNELCDFSRRYQECRCASRQGDWIEDECWE